MKHCFKKFMALLLATLMVMSAFSGIAAVAADTICTHPEEKLTKWQVGGVETVDPTCTTDGYTWYKCECGKVTARDFVPAKGHKMEWMAKKVVIDTTTDANQDGQADAVVDYVNGVDCGDTYEIYYGCSRPECDYVEKWTGDGEFAPGYKTHHYDSYEITVNPTCKTHGELELICSNHADCPRIPVLIQRLNDNKGEHEFAIGTGNEIVLENAKKTCTTDGYKIYACIYCYVEDSKATHKVTDKATGHTYQAQYDDDAKGYNSGTQYVAGKGCLVEYACNNCTSTASQYVHQWAAAKEHFPNKAGATANSCYDAYKCGNCTELKDVEYRHIPKTTATTYTVDAENNVCVAHYTCKDCGYRWDVSSKDDVSAHENRELIAHEDPTCTDFGYDSYVCRSCGAKFLETTDPLGHKTTYTKAEYDAAAAGQTSRVRIKTATCLEDGGIYVTCGRNGCTHETLVEKTADKLGHAYEIDAAQSSPANCISVSITVYVCKNAGCTRPTYSERGTAIAEDAHKMEDYVVTTFPTCETDGIASLFCTLCHFEDTAIKNNDDSKARHPNFDFNKITKFNHVYNPFYHSDKPGYIQGLANLPENKDTNTENDITVSTTIEATTKTTIAATCVYEGKVTSKCDICQVVDTQVSPKNPDNHAVYGNDGTGSLVINGYYEGGYKDLATGKVYLRLPNCDKPGLLWYECASCHQAYSMTDDAAQAPGHDDHTQYQQGRDEYEAYLAPDCANSGHNAKYVIHCDNKFDELVRVKGLTKTTGTGTAAVTTYWADMNNNNVVDNGDVEIGVAGTEYADYRIGDGRYVVKTFERYGITYTYYLYATVEVPCTHISTIYVDDKGQVVQNYEIDRLKHDWEVTGEALKAYQASDKYAAAKLPNCEQGGNLAKWYCSKCQDYKVENGVKLNGAAVSALGHSWQRAGYVAGTDFVKGYDSTCTETGRKDYNKCSTCGGYDIITDADKKLGDNVIDGNAADDSNIIIPKKPHTPAERTEALFCGVEAHMKAPTCVENGYGFGSICSVCHGCAEDHDKIDAIGHKTAKLTRNTTVTCEDPTFTFEFCYVCGHVSGCAARDGAKFEEKTPVCVEDHDDLVIKNGGLDLSSVALTIGENAGSFKYVALKFTYSFADDKNVKAAFDAEGANYYVELKTAAGKSVAKWTLAYVGGTYELDTTYLTEDLKVTTNLTAEMYQKSTFKFDYIPDTVYGCREIDDFVYYTDHKYATAIKPLEGNGYACECVGYIEYQGCLLCTDANGYPTAKPGSEVEVEAKGHVIKDHLTETITSRELPCTADCDYCKANNVMVDAHENTYVYDEDFITVRSVVNSSDPATLHVISKFKVYACTKCAFRDIEIASVGEETHHWEYDPNAYVAPTYEKEGSQTKYCKDNCGVAPVTETIEKLTATKIDMSVTNADMAGNVGFTDGSLIAVTVNLSSLETLMWGFTFDVDYDHTLVSFEGYEFLTTSFESNQAVKDHIEYDPNGNVVADKTFVRVAATTLTPYDPENPGATAGATNVNFSGTEALVVLYFRVNSPEQTAKVVNAKFEFKNDNFVNNDNVYETVVENETTGDLNGDGKLADYQVKVAKEIAVDITNTATVEIRRFMNVCNDEAVDISDALYTWKILTGEFDTTYDVTVDVDKNGVIDVTDFQAIYKYVVGEKTYEEVRGMGIPA